MTQFNQHKQLMGMKSPNTAVLVGLGSMCLPLSRHVFSFVVGQWSCPGVGLLCSMPMVRLVAFPCLGQEPTPFSTQSKTFCQIKKRSSSN